MNTEKQLEQYNQTAKQIGDVLQTVDTTQQFTINRTGQILSEWECNELDKIINTAQTLLHLIPEALKQYDEYYTAVQNEAENAITPEIQELITNIDTQLKKQVDIITEELWPKFIDASYLFQATRDAWFSVEKARRQLPHKPTN